MIDYLEPKTEATYPQVLRTEGFVWWRSIVGVVLGLCLFILITPVVTQAVIGIGWGLTGSGRPFADYYGSAVRFEMPIGMIGANLGIAALIPVCWLLMIMVHSVRPRWLSSIRPKLRWRYLLAALGVAVVALLGVFLLTSLSGPAITIQPQQGFLGFMLVILLTSPLQAAAEEFFFRGYLMQALGSLFTSPWFGVVLSSVVFALFHGLQNPALFVDRLAFGLLAAILVMKTGGLEAGIAAHVINNIFAYGIAGLTSSIAQVRAISEIGWLQAASDVGGFALFGVLAWLLSRVMKLNTTIA